MSEGHTDIKHRPLSSLTPEECEDVRALLLLYRADPVNLGDPATNHVTLNISGGRVRHNALRVPVTCTVHELVEWARLLNVDVGL